MQEVILYCILQNDSQFSSLDVLKTEDSTFLSAICTDINSLRPSNAYICVCNLTIINSDNGLSPGRRQTII